MTATLSGRYLFGERVYDATQDLHEECMGQSRVAVVCADYDDEVITVVYHSTTAIARQWVAVEEWSPGNVSYHIVGDDIRE